MLNDIMKYGYEDLLYNSFNKLKEDFNIFKSFEEFMKLIEFTRKMYSNSSYISVNRTQNIDINYFHKTLDKDDSYVNTLYSLLRLKNNYMIDAKNMTFYLNQIIDSKSPFQYIDKKDYIKLDNNYEIDFKLYFIKIIKGLKYSNSDFENSTNCSAINSTIDKLIFRYFDEVVFTSDIDITKDEILLSFEIDDLLPYLTSKYDRDTTISYLSRKDISDNLFNSLRDNSISDALADFINRNIESPTVFNKIEELIITEREDEITDKLKSNILIRALMAQFDIIESIDNFKDFKLQVKPEEFDQLKYELDNLSYIPFKYPKLIVLDAFLYNIPSIDKIDLKDSIKELSNTLTDKDKFEIISKLNIDLSELNFNYIDYVLRDNIDNIDYINSLIAKKILINSRTPTIDLDNSL
jgi:hypothetical protein